MPCLVSNNRTCNLLDCTDSPLSITGNVLSILTFFIAALATYLAFFQNVRDIPQSADDYSNDIRSLHDQLWAIGDIHGQLAKLVADNENVRISDVHLQSRLQQGQSESLKEAQKFLADYSNSYQHVFTDYFKSRRWIVRLKWLLLQKKVAHFKSEALELRSNLTLDLLAIALDMNIALQQSLQQRDIQKKQPSSKLKGGFRADFSQKNDEDLKRPDSPSPSTMMDPTEANPPKLFLSAPEEEGLKNSRRSLSPLSTRRPLRRSTSGEI